MFHSYMHAVLDGLICTAKLNQQMNELPFMIVFQVLSLLKPCCER